MKCDGSDYEVKRADQRRRMNGGTIITSISLGSYTSLLGAVLRPLPSSFRSEPNRRWRWSGDRRREQDGTRGIRSLSLGSTVPLSLAFQLLSGPSKGAVRWERWGRGIRTFILPSWLLPLWPNRLTPRDRRETSDERAAGEVTDGTKRATREMQRLDWSLSRKVTQDIKTQPQINHYRRSSLHSPVVSLFARLTRFSALSLRLSYLVPLVVHAKRL